METISKIINDIGAFLTEVYNHPKSGYWIIIGILVFWLLGIILNWKWSYQPFGWLSNYFMDTFGPNTVRLGHAILLIIALACTVFLLIRSYK